MIKQTKNKKQERKVAVFFPWHFLCCKRNNSLSDVVSTAEQIPGSCTTVM